MFRDAAPQNTPRARPQVGNITPLALPSKGLNARDFFVSMGPEFAISLRNVLVEPYGLRTRKGYSEWATNIPGGIAPVSTVMAYYPPTVGPALAATSAFQRVEFEPMFRAHRSSRATPAGKLFAAKGGAIYEVTAGGTGPWVAEPVINGTGDYWTWLNFTNIAGTFLIVTSDEGGYFYYDGSTWVQPAQGTAAGEIDGVDPDLFVYVSVFKHRLWFVERGSTSAWYLPTDAIAGLAKEFDFGEQFPHGGHLVALASWTVDGGAGIDDYLIAVGSQGDVVIYQGVDPDQASDFQLRGVWYVGPLPVGRRQVTTSGGDVYILSQFGAVPISRLLGQNSIAPLGQQHLSYLVDPLIARLMQSWAVLRGWQILILAKEELVLIGVPSDVPQGSPTTPGGGDFFAYKTTTQGWSTLVGTKYASFAPIDTDIFAGTLDGRVVLAFDGQLDDVKLGASSGVLIKCRVTPAYSALGAPGFYKGIKLVRPAFLTTLTPTLRLEILLDYGPPRAGSTPTLPAIGQSLWDVALWDSAAWSGIQSPIKEWLGATGVGFAATVQLDYDCGADTLLTSIDFWATQGGVM